MASGRVTGTACLAIQASRRASKSGCNRTPTACPTPVLGGPGFFLGLLASRITPRLTPSSKNATFDCTVIRDNATVSTRTPFAEQAPPVKRALPVLGLLHAVGDVAAASIVLVRSRFAAGAAAFDKLVDRAVMVALLCCAARRRRRHGPLGSPRRRSLSPQRSR